MSGLWIFVLLKRGGKSTYLGGDGMYNYFSELDCPDDFKIYLKKSSFESQEKRIVSNVFLEDTFFHKYVGVFQKLSLLDLLFHGLREELTFMCPYLMEEEYLHFCDFFQYKENHFTSLQEDSSFFISNVSDLKYLLSEYFDCCEYLIKIFPQFQEILMDTKKEIKTMGEDLEKKMEILLPSDGNGVIFTCKNAWFLTPSGYLYNTGGKDGHKNGNLVYPFSKIYDSLLQNENVSAVFNKRQIQKILERGYVTSREFRNFANLVYSLPTILTPEVEHDIMRYQNIMKLPFLEYEQLVQKEDFSFPTPERSYQSNIIKLVVGHLAAEEDLFHSFQKVNASKRKKDIIQKIYTFSNQDFSDILVRYSGFHKVESCEKKITTSSLYGIEEFQNYLNQGWSLYIIPKIVYDDKLDDVQEMDFSSYFIDRHFDKVLSNYEGKGKILIRGKNV